MSNPQYEVYAIKYAHHPRRASENFIGGDPHDGPMPLDYFIWLVRGGGREIVVDTGFSPAMAAKRGRQHLRCPTEGLRFLNCDPLAVKDVVITHLHYDHVGNFDLFPTAALHLQDLEMRYATGRHMSEAQFGGAYEVEDVVGMVRRAYAGRVRFLVYDRYVLDSAVHLRWRYGLDRTAARILTSVLVRLSPKPIRSFYLEMPPAAAQRRKMEDPLEDLREQAEIYREELVTRAGSGVVVLDGTRPAEELATIIAEEVWAGLHHQAASRRRPWNRLRRGA